MPRKHARPTLWRTCRALANRRRLQILSLLSRESPQTVSSVAGRLGLRLSLTSQYLRALEARGLLAVRRVGRQAQYRVQAASETNHGLAQTLRSVLKRDAASLEAIFNLCTAFTHPRRIEIFRALRQGAGTLAQLRSITGIPYQALQRHLRKLSARGFVARRSGVYSAAVPAGAVSRALTRLAQSPPKRSQEKRLKLECHSRLEKSCLVQVVHTLRSVELGGQAL